jgi:hypothetical protein
MTQDPVSPIPTDPQAKEPPSRGGETGIVVPAPEGLLNIETGELLPATVDNAAIVIQACRDMRAGLNDIVNQATAWLVSEAERRGTKTLHTDETTITLTGGLGQEYDAQDLMMLLREAGCPEDRIEAAVVEHVEYRVNRSVLKQLAVNQEYKAAIGLAAREIEKPWRASVKTRRDYQ